jgi:uncharacterized protein
MADEQPPESQTAEPQTRRARLALRRHRVRVIVITCLIVLVVAGAGGAVALRAYDADSAPLRHDPAAAVGTATEPNLGDARKLEPPRKLSHEQPLKLWIGGDSLAGSFGPALGQIAGATGVVDATIDYKVSSGLADQGIRDWPEHAAETMATDDPDAVVFIVGTNDASIANTYDGDGDGTPDWEHDYRARIDTMMQALVGGNRHRTVFWLGPPTLGDSNLDRGTELIGPVMAQEAHKFAPDVIYVDTYKLFEGPDGGYSRSLPDASGEEVDMRISDGVHFSIDGAEYLSNIVWKLLDKRWQISKQAVPSQPIDYTIAEGSNDYVPGIGDHYSSGNGGYDGGSSSDTTPATTPPSATTAATSPATAPPTTGKPPPATTPPTTKTTSPPTSPVTVPHVTSPPH